MKRFWLLGALWISLLGSAEVAPTPISSEAAPPASVELPPAPAPAPIETPQSPVEPPPVATEAPSGPSESQLVIAPPCPWMGGFQVAGLGAFSSVDYDEGYSGGLGWSFALSLEKRLSPSFRALAGFGFQSLSIARFVGSSGGPVVDPASEFIQTQKGPFLQGLAGVPLMDGFVDFGLEYFHATSAQQTGINSAYDFSPSKFLFLVAGPSYSMKIRGDWIMEGHAWFFVNTVGDSRFKLMGGRLELALRAPL